MSQAKYSQLTTFRRDGTPVATPAHIAAEPGDAAVAYFRTWVTQQYRPEPAAAG